MSATPPPFPKSRKMIADAIEEAIFDAFGIEPPEGNAKPIQNSGKPAKDERSRGQ